VKRFEYKLHRLTLTTGRSNDEQVLEALNRLGEDGWRLNRMYGEFGLRSLAFWRGSVNFLLEREVDDEPIGNDPTNATAIQDMSS